MPYIDFQEVKAKVKIDDAAQKLGLTLKEQKNQLRGACPSCNAGGDRALVITPERGLFYCFSAKIGGDCLALVQHITGIDVQEAAQFLLPQEEPHSAPSPDKKAPEKREPTRQSFDPAAFAEKLEYTDEVQALGISEEDARALGIGMYRSKLYQALRYEDGSCAGYSAISGDIKLPSKLLPQVHNVVAFPKRA